MSDIMQNAVNAPGKEKRVRAALQQRSQSALSPAKQMQRESDGLLSAECKATDSGLGSAARAESAAEAKTSNDVFHEVLAAIVGNKTAENLLENSHLKLKELRNDSPSKFAKKISEKSFSKLSEDSPIQTKKPANFCPKKTFSEISPKKTENYLKEKNVSKSDQRKVFDTTKVCKTPVQRIASLTETEYPSHANAIIQTFYAMEELRIELFKINTARLNAAGNWSAAEVAAVNSVTELQRLMGLMAFSSCASVDPRPFLSTLAAEQLRDPPTLIAAVVEALEIAWKRVFGSADFVRGVLKGRLQPCFEENGELKNGKMRAFGPLTIEIGYDTLERALDNTLFTETESCWIVEPPRYLVFVVKAASEFRIPGILSLSRYIPRNSEDLCLYNDCDFDAPKEIPVIYTLHSLIGGGERCRTWVRRADSWTRFEGATATVASPREVFLEGGAAANCPQILVYALRPKTIINRYANTALIAYVREHDSRRAPASRVALPTAEAPVEGQSAGDLAGDESATARARHANLSKAVWAIVLEAKKEDNRLFESGESAVPRFYDFRLFIVDSAKNPIERMQLLRHVALTQVTARCELLTENARSYSNAVKQPELRALFQKYQEIAQLNIEVQIQERALTLFDEMRVLAATAVTLNGLSPRAATNPTLYLDMVQSLRVPLSRSGVERPFLRTAAINLVFLALALLRECDVPPGAIAFVNETAAVVASLSKQLSLSAHMRFVLGEAISKHPDFARKRDGSERDKANFSFCSEIEQNAFWTRLRANSAFAKLAKTVDFLREIELEAFLALPPTEEARLCEAHSAFAKCDYALSAAFAEALSREAPLRDIMSSDAIRWPNVANAYK